MDPASRWIYSFLKHKGLTWISKMQTQKDKCHGSDSTEHKIYGYFHTYIIARFMYKSK